MTCVEGDAASQVEQSVLGAEVSWGSEPPNIWPDLRTGNMAVERHTKDNPFACHILDDLWQVS
jgi:hypothetical protein